MKMSKLINFKQNDTLAKINNWQKNGLYCMINRGIAFHNSGIKHTISW